MSRSGEDKVAAYVLTAIVVIAAIILFMRAIYPYTIIATILAGIALIISIIRDWNSSPFEDSYSVPIFIVLLVCGGVSFISYQIGFVLGDSPTGQMILQTAKTLGIVDEMKENATMQAVDISEQASMQIANQTNATASTKTPVGVAYDLLRLGILIR